jgi:phosphoribosyl-ATP pyrophosphohydrolase/phosphoribosyl-AMP cyclohydrolase
MMLGYMNPEALQKTIKEKIVTFYSRSKKRLWTKGEKSGNFLHVKDILPDCDTDTLLITVDPAGPVCHKGTTTCFGHNDPLFFIPKLEKTIHERIHSGNEKSYTKSLYQKGLKRISQKVGEEAVELILEAGEDDNSRFKEEAADLLYHFLVLLKSKKLTLDDIDTVLRSRS